MFPTSELLQWQGRMPHEECAGQRRILRKINDDKRRCMFRVLRNSDVLLLWPRSPILAIRAVQENFRLQHHGGKVRNHYADILLQCWSWSESEKIAGRQLYTCRKRRGCRGHLERRFQSRESSRMIFSLATILSSRQTGR
jgi:hypothetical protein